MRLRAVGVIFSAVTLYVHGSRNTIFSATKYLISYVFVPLLIDRDWTCPSGMKGTFVLTPVVGGFGTIWRTSSPVRLE